jgi:hypothetical protein
MTTRIAIIGTGYAIRSKANALTPPAPLDRGGYGRRAVVCSSPDKGRLGGGAVNTLVAPPLRVS